MTSGSVSFLCERVFDCDFSTMKVNHPEIGRAVQAAVTVLIREPVTFCSERSRGTRARKVGSGFIRGVNSPSNPVFNNSRSRLTFCRLYQGT